MSCHRFQELLLHALLRTLQLANRIGGQGIASSSTLEATLSIAHVARSRAAYRFQIAFLRPFGGAFSGCYRLTWRGRFAPIFFAANRNSLSVSRSRDGEERNTN